MTKRKRDIFDRYAASGLSTTRLLSANLELLATDLTYALEWYPDDAELARYVEDGDAMWVAARVVELYMTRTRAESAAAAAREGRRTATAARNKADAAAVRAAALRKFDRLMAAKNRTPAEALSLGWTDDAQRDRVRRWVKQRGR